MFPEIKKVDDDELEWTGFSSVNQYYVRSVYKLAYTPDVCNIKNFNQGMLFMYMHHRFGCTGLYDVHKEVGNWDLSTPDPEVLLAVSPKFHLDYCFFVMLTEKLYRELMDLSFKDEYREDPMKNPVWAERIVPALKVSMLELLVPVMVRDMPFTMFGDMTFEPNPFKRVAAHMTPEGLIGGYTIDEDDEYV